MSHHTTPAEQVCSYEVNAAYSASVKLILREIDFHPLSAIKKKNYFEFSQQNPAIFLSDVIGMDFED